MTHTIYRDGKPWRSFSTPEQCVAEILVKGWIEPVERFGVVWCKGVEIRQTEHAVARETESANGLG